MEISLAAHIRQTVPLDKRDEVGLASFIDVRTVSGRSSVFGPLFDKGVLAFIERGLLRLYSVDDQANERTLQFGVEGCWMGGKGFDVQRPSKLHLQAVEESRVVLIRLDAYETLLVAHPLLERYFLKVHQRAHVAAQRRIHLLAQSNGEERYRQFQQHYRAFVQRVPQYMLASFLGLTPEWLSKIRAKRS